MHSGKAKTARRPLPREERRQSTLPGKDEPVCKYYLDFVRKYRNYSYRRDGGNPSVVDKFELCGGHFTHNHPPAAVKSLPAAYRDTWVYKHRRHIEDVASQGRTPEDMILLLQELTNTNNIPVDKKFMANQSAKFRRQDAPAQQKARRAMMGMKGGWEH